MRAFNRLLRLAIFSTVLLTFSSCCCCDPELLGQFSEGVGEGFEKELEAKMAEEAAKIEAQAAEVEAQATKVEAEAKKLEANAKKLEAEANKVAAQADATAKATKGVTKEERIGVFKDTKLDKKNLTGGSLMLQVNAKNEIEGRFLGQYYRKPFSIDVKGKLTPDGLFQATGKAEDSDITVKGSHEGTQLTGKVNGRVRSKAIDAKFAATRRK